MKIDHGFLSIGYTAAISLLYAQSAMFQYAFFNGVSMNMNINSLSQKYSVRKLDENDIDMT